MSATIAEKVDAGIAYLDSEQPDWRTKLDIDTLDVCSASRCILGQVYGSFWRAPELRGIFSVPTNDFDRAVQWGVDHGFSLRYSENGDVWNQLQQEWLSRLTS